ncbi:hypothetical protein [Haliea sp. E17]|uniref:hypothetical protein n=1 Tax=Haliea sp. E17 TaxID=3401576 RepID=UPI003AAC637E
MAVVDTFTKLIFDQGSEYSSEERAIIETLRLVDDNLLPDSPQEMGAYLRALGVQEMIELVSQVVARLGREAAVGELKSAGETYPRGSQRLH